MKGHAWNLLTLIALITLMAFVAAPAMSNAQETGAPDPGVVADVMDADPDDDGSDPGDDGANSNAEDMDEEETSAFQNPAQAQKAENLAIAEAVKTDTTLAGLVDALEAAEADPESTLEDIEAAEQAVADRLAEIAGMDHSAAVKDIADMREMGYGWGQIAHDLGVHPSVLGLGNKYGHTHTHQHNAPSNRGLGKKGGLAASTARDVKTGWGAKGHGVGQGKGKGSRDDADAFGSAAAKGKSKSNAGGKGGGKGNNNGNGNGNGNGKQ